MGDLWTVAEIVEAVKGQCSLEPEAQKACHIGSISIDSRTLEQGALYVAIQGVSQDGHKFVGPAFQAGAGAALVREGFQVEGGESQGVLIYVPDTLAALEALGRTARARTEAKIIAVTGSAGKTGTKEALHSMLECNGPTHASVKSFNNHWGVPLSLARMPQDSVFGVFEVGMNHAGEIEPLSKMIAPDVALITTVAPVHIGHFANEEEIADAKAEIFAGVKPGGGVILPADNRHYERLVASAHRAGIERIIGFGRAEGAPARLLEGQFDREGSVVRADILGQLVRFKIAMPGEHIALNFVGALAGVSLLGGDVQRAAEVLERLAPPEGRGGRYELSLPNGSFLLIDESYNANPASMEVALKNLSMMRGQAYSRRIAVLGDMLELGARSKAYHQDIAAQVGNLEVNLVFAAGEMMRDMFEQLPLEKQAGYGATSIELCSLVEKKLQPGDVVMVKGSLGSQMGHIVQRLKDNYKA